MDEKNTYATVVVGDDFSPGVIALASSLELSGVSKQLVVLHSELSTINLSRIGSLDIVSLIPIADLPEPIVALPSVISTEKSIKAMAKMHCWQLAAYDKVVYLDADTCVYRNTDHMFDFPELTACPGQPLFNSGVMVLQPSKRTFQRLMAEVTENAEQWDIPRHYFRGSAHDQMLLAGVFADRFNIIGREYNATNGKHKTVLAGSIIVRHWNGPRKPWQDGGGDPMWYKFWPSAMEFKV